MLAELERPLQRWLAPSSPNVTSSKTQVALGFLLVALGFLLLALGVWGLYHFVTWAVAIFARLNTNVAASIVAGVATITVSVVTVIVGRRLEANAAIRKEHREKKIPVYEDLIEFMSKVLLSAKSGAAPSEEEMRAFLIEFTRRIMVWGSDDVIAHWANFRTGMVNSVDATEGKAGVDMVFRYEELIYAIRRDLGHRNKGLTKGMVLSLFINDIEDYLEKKS
jgi:hypothetical protein